MASRWSDQADRSLFNGLGAYGLSWFQRKSGKSYAHMGPKTRSKDAVYARIRRIYGPGGLTRGVHTLHELVNSTGYTVEHFRRAQAALNQKWKRTSLRGSHLISDDQAQDLIEWLKHDYWNSTKRLYACLWCTTSRQRHRGIGLCIRCYYRHRRLCRVLDVPQTPSGQLNLLSGVKNLDNQVAHRRFVEYAKGQLDKGLALGEFELEWLVILKDPYVDVGRDSPGIAGAGRRDEE